METKKLLNYLLTVLISFSWAEVQPAQADLQNTSRLEWLEQLRQSQMLEILADSNDPMEVLHTVRSAEAVVEVEQIVRQKLKISAEKQTRFISALLHLSLDHQIDPVLILATIENESQFNTMAIGAAGERGIMQILPETAKWIAKTEKLKWKGADSLFDPEENLKIGVGYLSYLKRSYSSSRIFLSAFNMGPGRTNQLLKRNKIPKLYYNKVVTAYLKISRLEAVSSAYESLQPLSLAKIDSAISGKQN